MSESEVYDIHPEDFYKSLWLTPLYTAGAAVVTSALMLLFGEALEEFFIILSCAYGLIGFASGSAVKRCLGSHPILPGYVLAMGWTILGIAICQFTSLFISMAFFAGTPLVEALTMAVSGLPVGASRNVNMALSFDDPLISVVLLAQVPIALAFTWQALRSEDDPDD